MPAAAADESISQAAREGLNAKRVEPHQSHITERSRQLARIIELLFRYRRHRGADIEEHAHRHTGLNLKHLEKELLETHVRAPVDGPKVVTVMKMTMIQKLLSATGETGDVMAANQAGKGLLP